MVSAAVFPDEVHPLAGEALEGFDLVGVDGVVHDAGNHGLHASWHDRRGAAPAWPVALRHDRSGPGTVQGERNCPACPVAESLPVEVEQKLKSIEGINEAKVELTFDPPFTQDMMSEAAKLELGFL